MTGAAHGRLRLPGRWRGAPALAAVLVAGCTAFQDMRPERLQPEQVEKMRTQLTPPEQAGFNAYRLGSQVISFSAKSWLDGDEAATLPMINALDRGETHVIVEALLNEKVRVPVTLDTGSESDVLSPSLVDKLKMPLFDMGKDTMTVRGVGGSQQAFPGALASLRLGGCVIHNSIAVVLTEQHRAYTLGFFGGGAVDSGILGLNALGRFRWVTFDWHRRKVTFGRAGAYSPDLKKLVETVPFERAGGKLISKGKIAKGNKTEDVDFILDTGSDDVVMVPQPMAERMGLLDPFAGERARRWITGLGGSYRAAPVLVGYVQLGRLKFVRASGHTVPSTTRALLGNKLMRKFKTTFDFAQSKLVFENP